MESKIQKQLKNNVVSHTNKAIITVKVFSLKLEI